MNNKEDSCRITLLDGGMGRELLRMGAPFRQPEWSALALMQAPAMVKKAHESFAAAGSDILTTSNYAVVPFHLGKDRFLEQGAALTDLAGRLAREAASGCGCRVAGSIPPLFGSYRPDLFVAEQARPLLTTIIDALSPHVDLWLAETVSSTREMQAVANALTGDGRPLWIACTLMDDESSKEKSPSLRSGQSVVEAVHAALDAGASALLFNCSQPEVMAPAVADATEESRKLKATLPIGVYANAFPPHPADAVANSSLSEIRPDLTPENYADFAGCWSRLGATIIGGCCGIGPEHIAALKTSLRERITLSPSGG
jgi:S-methylmethionine-dependent homocysteine/selenocysteine methylase